MAIKHLNRLNYKWEELSRKEKTDILTVAMLRNICIIGNGYRIGMREINVNIGKHKNNLRIDVLEINKRKNALVGYEIKSCIEDFRADKKWENYLTLINQLYFVFDSETFEKHNEEILQKIGNKAGVYTYSHNYNWITFVKGGQYFQLEPKDETFYRTILFNYLLRKAQLEIRGNNASNSSNNRIRTENSTNL
ncbi:MAG: MmcB family DNA repair protein [Cyanobacteria bacterium SIG32]|nr:MmcB family DNA repair protein [Cyanobacteria bacterium SIG32]